MGAGWIHLGYWTRFWRGSHQCEIGMWLGSGRVSLSYSGNQSSFLTSLGLNEIIPSWHVPILTVYSSSLYRRAAWHLMFGLTPAGPECPLLSPGLKWLSASAGPPGSALTPSAPQQESEHSALRAKHPHHLLEIWVVEFSLAKEDDLPVTCSSLLTLWHWFCPLLPLFNQPGIPRSVPLTTTGHF